MRDDLGQQRVVERRHRRADAHAGVDADRAGEVERRHDARRGQEARRGVLGDDPQLHRPAVEAHVRLREPQRLAGRDAQLLLDEVEARHGLGHRVLHLQAGVDLEEEERPVARRAGTPPSRRWRTPRSARAAGPPRPSPPGSGRVTAGDGDSSISFWCRRWTLHSRSPRWTSVPWASPRIWTSTCRGRARYRSSSSRSSPNDAAASRRAASSASSSSDGLAHDPHPAAAAPGARLHQQRVPDLAGVRAQGLVAGVLAVVAGQDGHPARLGQRLGPRLVAEGAHGGGRRPDPRQPGVRARVGEVGALAEEAVARVDRLGAGRRGRREDRVDPQVALGGRSRADAHGLVGRPDVRRRPVGVGVDGDRADPEPAARAHDPQRDLAAVGHQDGREHPTRRHRYIRNTPNGVSGIGALSAAERPRPSTMRVSAGSMIPSSHRRAVEK